PMPHGVEMTLANGTTVTGQALVGADGVGSRVRRQLHPGERPPHSSGLVGVRGVARDAVRHLAGVSGAQYLGRGIEAGVARATESDVYWFICLHARDVSGAGGAAAIARAAAAGFHRPFQDIVAATRAEDIRLDELLERDALETWGEGCVTLLG